jgi:hypothetical protein
VTRFVLGEVLFYFFQHLLRLGAAADLRAAPVNGRRRKRVGKTSSAI